MQEKHTSYDGINVCRECGLNHIKPGGNIRFEDELELPGYMQLLSHNEFKNDYRIKEAKRSQNNINSSGVLIHLVHKFKYYKISCIVDSTQPGWMFDIVQIH